MWLRICLVWSLLLLPGMASAEVLILLQGYQGGDEWRRSGVAGVLFDGGWVDAGHLHETPHGIASNRPDARAGRQFYSVDLPTGAPLLLQLRQLENAMGYVLAHHANETLFIAGHSAGGVLGRLYMVQHPDVPVAALITIASPHLGTGTAELGALLGDTPLGWISPLLGAEEFNRSQSLYRDLVREQPGSLLFWLNRQPHPAARYISIVRREESPWSGSGDWFVPSASQDMNNVMALRGRAQTLVSPGNHSLGPDDGVLLLNLLNSLQRS